MTTPDYWPCPRECESGSCRSETGPTCMYAPSELLSTVVRLEAERDRLAAELAQIGTKAEIAAALDRAIRTERDLTRACDRIRQRIKDILYVYCGDGDVPEGNVTRMVGELRRAAATPIGASE